MEAAFLLQVGRRPATVIAGADELAFRPGGHHAWSDATRRVRIDAWRGEGGAAVPWWTEQEGGIAAVVGHVRHRGRSWAPPGAWARELWSIGPVATEADLCHRLRGMFGAVLLTRSGDGWLAADPLGFRCLYIGEGPDHLVVSSRAALAAAALGSRTSNARDTESVAWLAATTYHVGDRSGFEGVRVLRPGAVLRLTGGRPSWEQVGHPLLEAADRQPIEDVAAALVDEVTESLHAALSFPAERHVIGLTGGKDSRLILAAAVRAGIHQEFEYETVGPPQLADVVVAEQLAAELDLRHQSRFLGLKQPKPFASLVRTFVEDTGGLVNGWDQSAPTDPNELRITGIGGESLRSFRRLPGSLPPDGDLGAAFPRDRFGRLGLLRDEVADRLHAELTDALRTEPHPSAGPFSRLHCHFLGHRVRFARVGPREEVHQRSIRYQPLYSWDTCALGQLVLDDDRASAVLVAEAMRQCSELLVRHPFASGSWDERATAHLDARPPGPGRPSANNNLRPTALPTPGPGVRGADRRGLMEHLSSTSSDEREQLLLDAFADGDNPAWLVLDPDRVRRSLGRWTELAAPQRRELFGAATVGIWMAGGPQVVPTRHRSRRLPWRRPPVG